MKFGNLIKCAAWIAALASVFACAKEVGPGYEEGLPVTSIKMSISGVRGKILCITHRFSVV